MLTEQSRKEKQQGFMGTNKRGLNIIPINNKQMPKKLQLRAKINSMVGGINLILKEPKYFLFNHPTTDNSETIKEGVLQEPFQVESSPTATIWLRIL